MEKEKRNIKGGAIEYGATRAQKEKKKALKINAKKPSDLTDAQVKKLVYELAKIYNLI